MLHKKPCICILYEYIFGLYIETYYSCCLFSVVLHLKKEVTSLAAFRCLVLYKHTLSIILWWGGGSGLFFVCEEEASNTYAAILPCVIKMKMNWTLDFM